MKRVQLAPRVNANDDRVEVVHLYVQNGDRVQPGDSLLDLGTSKATVLISAEHEGLVKYHCGVGEKVPVGSPLASFFEDESALAKDRADMPDTAGPARAAARPVSTPQGISAPAALPLSSEVDLTRKFPFVRFTPAAEAMIQARKLEKALFEGRGIVSRRVVEAVLGAKPGPPEERRSKQPSVALRNKRVVGPKAIEIQQLGVGQSGHINSTLSAQFGAEAAREAASGKLVQRLAPARHRV